MVQKTDFTHKLWFVECMYQFQEKVWIQKSSIRIDGLMFDYPIKVIILRNVLIKPHFGSYWLLIFSAIAIHWIYILKLLHSAFPVQDLHRCVQEKQPLIVSCVLPFWMTVLFVTTMWIDKSQSSQFVWGSTYCKQIHKSLFLLSEKLLKACLLPHSS